eukprot:PhF_6_TR7912/c0_g1_i1/m.11778
MTARRVKVNVNAPGITVIVHVSSLDARCSLWTNARALALQLLLDLQHAFVKTLALEHQTARLDVPCTTTFAWRSVRPTRTRTLAKPTLHVALGTPPQDALQLSAQATTNVLASTKTQCVHGTAILVTSASAR